MAIDRSGRMLFYPGKSTSSFSPRVGMGSGWAKFNKKAILTGVDASGDNRTDILYMDSSGNLLLYPGQGNSKYSSRVTIASGLGTFKHVFIVRNGVNHKPTVYGLKSNGQLNYYVPNGTSKIKTSGTVRDSAGKVINFNVLADASAIEDFDKDGYSDLVKVTAAGELALYRGQAQGFDTKPIIIGGYGWEPFTRIFYCDGTAETTCIFAVHSSGNLYRYTWTIKGTPGKFMAIPKSQPVAPPAPAKPKVGYTAPTGYLQVTDKIKPLTATNTLTAGMNGVKVKIVQRKLGIWYTSRLATMDSSTMAAVKNFQRRVGLSATGVVNKATWDKLKTGYAWTIDQYQAKPVALTATKSQRIDAMIDYAMDQRGSQYVWGGAGSYNLGFDCSGLALQALYRAGLDPQPINVIKHAWPTYRSSRELYNHPKLKHYPLAQRKRGDLIFYRNSAGSIYHVGIYLGNNKMVHTDVMGKPARVQSIYYADLAPQVVRPFV